MGGDYFSFTALDEGGLGIFIGDVTGHGVPAALFLSLVRSVSNQACRKYGMSPGKYIEMINNEVYRGMPSYYLTALYGVFRNDPGWRSPLPSRAAAIPIRYCTAVNLTGLSLSRPGAICWAGRKTRNSGKRTVDSATGGPAVSLYGRHSRYGEPESGDARFDDRAIHRPVPGPGRLHAQPEAGLPSSSGHASFRKGAPLVDDIILIGVEVT